MIGVFDPRELAHAPAREIHNGGWVDHVETPARAASIVAALPGLLPAVDHGLAPIAAVHSGEYLDFLRDAHRLWRDLGRDGDALPYVWPVVARRPLALTRIDALLGRFSFDVATPITAATWDSAYWSAQTALTSLGHALAGTHAFALCRPPGHHAGSDYFGGYCYLNNAAIAARAAIAAGRRVAILDVDYHHGNGTQDIVLADPDIFFASLHADPASDYPFFWGHADECDATMLNLPLPRGTGIATYLPALETALAAIAAFGPDLLIVSFGADTFAGDPISGFSLATADYAVLAARIAALGRPTLVVMEGGYATVDLGANVAAFLNGF